MDIPPICVQPVALHALSLGNPKARQKHEAHGGERDRVHTVLFGDSYRLAELFDLADAQAALFFLPSELTHALGRVERDDVEPRGVREEALQCRKGPRPDTPSPMVAPPRQNRLILQL